MAHARVACVPFATAANRALLGSEVAAAWRDDLAERLAPAAGTIAARR